jgi:hydroxymethylglutaryl-CoA lyase
MREVGTRDGLQSIGAFIPTESKIELVNLLSAAGIRRIEATSFVSPKAIPQMADAAEVMARIERKPGTRYEALIPNLRGAQDAIAANVDALVLVVTASETFNQKNVRMSVADSLAQFVQIKAAADAAKVHCNATIGTSFGCPYEGEITQEYLFGLISRLVDIGFTEIELADSTGMANPTQIERTAGEAMQEWGGSIQLGLHFHNTRGMGLANVVAGLRAGVDQFDASIAGIGGCPFAPKATGNISTEDTVHMLMEMGIETGIDLEKLIAAALRAQEILGFQLPGQVMKAGPARQLHAA